MRRLGAESLKAICELDLGILGPQVEARVVSIFSDSIKDINNRQQLTDFTP